MSEVQAEDALRKAPRVAFGTESRTQTRIAVRGSILYIAHALVERIVKAQTVFALLARDVEFRILDRLVTEGLQDGDGERTVPDAELVDAAGQGQCERLGSSYRATCTAG